MATEAPISGGVVMLLGTSPQRLSSSETPCRQLTIRSHEGNDVISIGFDSNTSTGHRFGFVLELEPFTIGPFGPNQGVRPCDIWVVGTPGEYFTWSGYHS